MQNSDRGKHDLSLLQTQVKGIDESLKELKKSDGVIENLKSQVSDFGVRVCIKLLESMHPLSLKLKKYRYMERLEAYITHGKARSLYIDTWKGWKPILLIERLEAYIDT